MIIGCVKEIKKHEYRVGLIPQHTISYIEHGHTVLIEKGAGIGSGFSDEEYSKAGAVMIDDAAGVAVMVPMVALCWASSSLAVRVPYWRA